MGDYSENNNYLDSEHIKTSLLPPINATGLDDADLVGNSVWSNIKARVHHPEESYLTEIQAQRIHCLNNINDDRNRIHNVASNFAFLYFFPNLQELKKIESQGKTYLDVDRFYSLTFFFDAYAQDADILFDKLGDPNIDSIHAITAATNIVKAITFLEHRIDEDGEDLQLQKIKLQTLFLESLNKFYAAAANNIDNIRADNLDPNSYNISEYGENQYTKSFTGFLTQLRQIKRETEAAASRGSPSSRPYPHDHDSTPPISRAPSATDDLKMPEPKKTREKFDYRNLSIIYQDLAQSKDFKKYLQDTYGASNTSTKTQISYDFVPDHLKPIPIKEYKGWGFVFKISDDNKSIIITDVAENADQAIKSLKGKTISKINGQTIEAITTSCKKEGIDSIFKITSLFRLNNQLTLEDEQGTTTNLTVAQQKIYQVKSSQDSASLSPSSQYKLQESTITQGEYDAKIKDNIEKLTTVHDIFAHINKRFDLLEEMLEENPSLKIVMPVSKSSSGVGAFANDSNSLGKGLAIKQWETFFTQGISSGTPEFIEAQKKADETIKKMHQLFRDRHAELNKKFNNSSGNPRIIQDSIYPIHDIKSTPHPGPDCLHIWGANAHNWNLTEGDPISGGGMALRLGTQRKGLFGIITTPIYGIDQILEDDKTYSTPLAKPKESDGLSRSPSPSPRPRSSSAAEAATPPSSPRAPS